MKSVVAAAGGIKGVLKFTPSLEVTGAAGGGHTFLRRVPGQTALRLYDSVLGEQLRLGRLLEVTEDTGSVTLVVHEYDRKVVTSNWDKELVPLYLNPSTGRKMRGLGEGAQGDQVLHRVPSGYLQFFVEVSHGPHLHLTNRAMTMIRGIHAIVHVVRGLEESQTWTGDHWSLLTTITVMLAQVVSVGGVSTVGPKVESALDGVSGLKLFASALALPFVFPFLLVLLSYVGHVMWWLGRGSSPGGLLRGSYGPLGLEYAWCLGHDLCGCCFDTARVDHPRGTGWTSERVRAVGV